jgi:hypothetical protein
MLRRERFEYLEDVAGFFLVLQQVAEMAIGLGKGITGFGPARIAQQRAVGSGFEIGLNVGLFGHGSTS